MYDRKDARGVPISAGIPPIVVVAAVIGLIVIFIVGGLVISASAFGHAWPASTAVKVPLNS